MPRSRAVGNFLYTLKIWLRRIAGPKMPLPEPSELWKRIAETEADIARLKAVLAAKERMLKDLRSAHGKS